MHARISIAAAAALLMLAGGEVSAQNAGASNAAGALAPETTTTPTAPAPTIGTANQTANGTPATIVAPTAGDQVAMPAPRPHPRGFPWGVLGLIGLVGLWPLFRKRDDG